MHCSNTSENENLLPFDGCRVVITLDNQSTSPLTKGNPGMCHVKRKQIALKCHGRVE